MARNENSRQALRRAAAVTALIMALPALAQAQARPVSDFTLEELMRIQVEPVFGASKRLQPVTEAPASVTIVTAEEIARYGYRTLAEVLAGVRGFYVANDRNYSWLGQRGFLRPGDFNTHVLLLVDGHRMNDDVFEQAALGRDVGLDAAMFERVEIVRGPSSSLYGTSAFFAVINVIMRKGADLHGARASVDSGSFGSRNVHVAFGKVLAGGADVALSGTYSATEGPARLYFPAFDTPATNNGIAERLDDERAGQLFGRMKFAHLTLTGAYGGRAKGVPTASYGSAFGDARLRTLDRRGFIDGEYERTMKNTDVVLRASLDSYRYGGLYPLQEAPGTPISEYFDYTTGLWSAAEARASRRLRFKQQLTVGAEFRDYFKQAQGATVDGGAEGGFSNRRSSRIGAVYVQDEIALLPALHVSAGARYDVYAGFSRVTPRAAVIATLSRYQSIKYLYGTAFRAPNAFEYDFYSSGVRNLALRPETMTSHELVWERYTSTWLRTSASLYRNRVASILTLVDDPTSALGLGWVNRDRIHSAGVELEGEWRFKYIDGLASYARQESRDPAVGTTITNSPRTVAKLRFSTSALPRTGTVAFETQYLGGRRTLAGGSAGAAAVANLTATQPLAHGIDIVAAVRNGFNTRYVVPGSREHRQDVLEQDGRTFTVGLRWRYLAR